MDAQMFHIFRNTPLGRESLLQTIHFCQMLNASPVIYIPEYVKFLMYFDNDVVQVDLDNSYLTAPETAWQHADELLNDAGLPHRFLTPKNFTASTLPDIPTNYDFMCCPRSISDLSSKIGLGHIGPKVRRIVKSAHFPVLITSGAFKPWTSITVCYGGSATARMAVRLGIRIARESGLPLNLFTHKEPTLENLGDDLQEELNSYLSTWFQYDSGVFEENLYGIPHDSLVVAGAYGHGLIKDILFGSKLEKIQSTLPNNLLIAGPNYSSGI